MFNFNYIFATIFLLLSPLYSSTISGTSGNNLTAFNGSYSELNKNTYNQNMNERAEYSNFGNCPALLIRCASSKCLSGCSSIEITYPIVSSCLSTVPSCQQYGDPLISLVSAEIIAKTNNKQKEKIIEDKPIIPQNNENIKQIEEKLEQVQSNMIEQNNKISAENTQNMRVIQEQIQQIKQNIEKKEQEKDNTNNNNYDNNGIQNDKNIANVSAETLAREELSGQVFTKLENVDTSLKNLKKIMQNTFEYAGCNSFGDNCKSPKRIAIFKQKALNFFDPYENTVDELYDAILLAQTIGIDITTIYMLLNNSCKKWAKVLCQADKCSPIQMLNDKDEVQLALFNSQKEGNSEIKIECVSDKLDEYGLFKKRRKAKENLDIEIIQQIIEQDSDEDFNVCKIDKNLNELKKLVNTKKKSNKICASCENYTSKQSDTNNECDCINPMFALCTTHSYNIGTNKNDIKLKSQLEETISLKTTFIAQQLKKQYNYLETTVKQFKIQLEKSLLTTKMESMGAASSETSSSLQNGLNGTDNCNNKDKTKEVFLCLRRNYGIINSSMNNASTNMNNIKYQIALDYETMCSNSYYPEHPNKQRCGKDFNYCKNKSTISTNQKTGIDTCLKELNAGTRQALEYIESQEQRKYNPINY